MFDFLTASSNLPFSVALLVMILIGLVEALGLGLSAAHIDMDLDVHGDGPDLLGWLGIGKVPLLMLLVSLLAWFGLSGLAIQQFVAAGSGQMLPAPIAALAALVPALPLTGLTGRFLARVMPQDETTAVPLDSLLGKRGVVTVGTARRGSPARVQVRDIHGQTHHVMVEPHGDDSAIGEGEAVLLVRREGDLFIGLCEADGLTPHVGQGR